MVYENFADIDEESWGSDDGLSLYVQENDDDDSIVWREWIGPIFLGSRHPWEPHRVQCLSLIQFRRRYNSKGFHGPPRTGFLLIMQNYQIVVA
jgi:hypothetical protein